MNGEIVQPTSPSKACTPVMPWTVNSIRIFDGRLPNMVNVASMPGPTCMRPVILRVMIDFIFSTPPAAS